MSKRLKLRAIGPKGDFVVTGQVARTLAALVKAGTVGITSLDVASWAFRTAAYVHDLRTDFGLAIETEWESHGDGWHARYRLLSLVTLLPEGPR